MGLIGIGLGIVVVLVAAAVAWARVRTAAAPSRIRSRDGQIMMEITSVGVAGGSIVIKGTFLGALPATTLIRPDEAWKALGLIGLRVVLVMPAFLVVGWWRCVRRPARAELRGPNSAVRPS